MQKREGRSFAPLPTLPSRPDFGCTGRKVSTHAGLPPQVALPPLTSALSRRAALFGAVASTGALAGSAAAAMVPPSLSANDGSLVAMATELRAIISAQTALIKDDPRDCDDVPGYLPLEERLFAIADALFEVSPDGLPGIVAVADIVQQLADNVGGHEFQAGHGHNLACDVLRIIGGRIDA